jgi:hypothetical protein
MEKEFVALIINLKLILLHRYIIELEKIYSYFVEDGLDSLL